MSRGRFCYWSVGSGHYADLLAAMVASARAVGVTEEFHLWTDREVPGATCHPVGVFENTGWLFKFVFLRREVAALDYDYVVYLDADSWFVRHPGDPAEILRDSPLHVALEQELTPALKIPVWWEYPVTTWLDLMRRAGVDTPRIYCVNAGLFIVRREAIPAVYQLALEFWRLAGQQGVVCVDEVLLAYAMQRLCADPERHTLAATGHFWATDDAGIFTTRLPEGRPFRVQGYHRELQLELNPAIVHLFRGKSVLFAAAARLRAGNSVGDVGPAPVGLPGKV